MNPYAASQAPMVADPFASSRGLSKVLLGAIGLRIALSVLGLGLRFVLPRGQHAFTIVSAWTSLQQLTVFVIVVLHIIWLRGVLVALRATGRPTKYSPNFAIWGWLIPFANIVLPYLSVKQAFDAQQNPGGLAIGWWIGYVLFTLNNAIQFRVPYLGLLLVIVTFGLWFMMVQALSAPAGAAAVPAFGAPLQSYGAPPPNVAFPPEWGWARIHLKSAQMKALGYYYRDKSAGPSFKIVFDLMNLGGPPNPADVARAARAFPASTFRLGAHETINAEGLPPDFAAMMTAKFESGDSPAGPQCAIILKLTRDEQRLYDLPPAPPGMEHYL